MHCPISAQPQRLPLRTFAGSAVAIVVVAALCGCSQRKPVVSDGVLHEESGDLLNRCVAAYNVASTLHAEGVLRDFRRGARRVVPISWDLARPSRCRLQIDRDLAIVQGVDCWTYRSATERFLGSRIDTDGPIEKTSRLLSDGAPFLLPELWERRDTALGKNILSGFAGWRLQGAAWSAERPCYVFVKPFASPHRESVLRIWIDQDVFLIRAWSIVTPSESGRERIELECEYHVLVVNGRLPGDVFQIRPPEPLTMPGETATSEESVEPTGDQP